MKAIHPLFFAAALLLPSLACGQASEVPGFISYQGRVLDSTGALVGAGAPINRTVTFRVWDHPSNTLIGNLIYSEQQTVTISGGEFSVLVGQGVATTSSPFGYGEGSKGVPTVNISSAFGGAQRYLGVTVDDGTAAVDNEITPRQQVVTTAFSFRSKLAEEVIGKVTATAGSTFTGGTFTGGSFTGGSFGSVGSPATFVGNGSGLTSLGINQITSGILPIARGGTGSGTQNFVDLTTDQSIGGAKYFYGTVGIGNSDPAIRLVAASSGIALPATSGTTPSVGTVARFRSSASAVSLDIGTASGGGNWLQSTHVTALNQIYPLLLNPNGGNVGIGTTAAAHQLDIKGATPTLRMANTDESYFGLTLEDQDSPTQYGAIRFDSSGNNLGLFNGSATPGMVMATSGNIGIGTTAPTRGKLHINGGAGSNPYSGTIGYLTTTGAASANLGTSNSAPSLYASGEVWALAFFAQSDERIKRVAGRSDGAGDLATLLGIEVTDYTYIDTIGKGAAEHKKLIAQQVEKVFPQAVRKSTDVVPDIYRKATVKDGWVSLATPLKKGERVRLIGKGKEGIHEVLEVTDGKFRTDFEADDTEVFVYGREVDDFHSVDYEAVAMLNVSATQQIKMEKDAEVTALKEENDALRASLAAQETRLTRLETRDKARDAKVTALEKLLSSSTYSVSHKTGTAVE